MVPLIFDQVVSSFLLEVVQVMFSACVLCMRESDALTTVAINRYIKCFFQ